LHIWLPWPSAEPRLRLPGWLSGVMRMDPGFYEDLAGRLYGLVIRLPGRLPGGQAQWLHHVTEAGEYGLALEDMAGMLAHAGIAIIDQERGGMLALAARMELEGGLVSRALAACPRLAGPGE
jgi:hypothetical protein